MGGRGHVHEAELKQRRRSAGRPNQELEPSRTSATGNCAPSHRGGARRCESTVSTETAETSSVLPTPGRTRPLTWRSALSHRNLAGAHDAGLVRSVRHSITTLDSGYRSVAMSSIPARAQSRRTQAEAARMTSVGRARTALTRMRSPDGSMKLTPDKSMMRIDGVCDSRSTSLEALTMSSSPLTASTPVSRAHGGRCRVVREFRERQVM